LIANAAKLHSPRRKLYSRAVADAAESRREAAQKPERPSTRALKRARQQQIRDLVATQRVASQEDLVRLLAERGFGVTQATVSRDIGEMGLIRMGRAGGHAYASPTDLDVPQRSDDAIRRVLTDLPVTIGRSGLILLLTGSPGSAPAVAEAIDRSSLTEQEGTLAGDNTVLVLFRDEERLERWQARLREIQNTPARPSGGA
jgi:transcriptional regulator of arginine metabolism